MTYFRRDRPDYHRRWRVSRSCSRWEGVVPRRYGRQTKRWLAGGVESGSAGARGEEVEVHGLIAPDTGAMRTVIGSSCTGN